MNVKTLIAATAIALLGSQAAFAQDTGKTREQVKAELAQARSGGKLDFAAQEVGLPLKAGNSIKTRAQVTQELATARANGELEPGATYGFIDAPAVVQAPVHAQAQ